MRRASTSSSVTAHFVSDRVDHFGAQRRGTIDEWKEKVGPPIGESQDCVGGCAELAGQMLRGAFANPMRAYQSAPVERAISARSEQRMGRGDALAHRPGKMLLHAVDSSSAPSVDRWSTSHQDADQAAVPIELHFFIADQFAGLVGLAAIADQRANAGERTHDPGGVSGVSK